MRVHTEHGDRQRKRLRQPQHSPPACPPPLHSRQAERRAAVEQQQMQPGLWGTHCPLPLLEAIFSQLDQASLAAAACTCRGWYECSLSPHLCRAVVFATPQRVPPGYQLYTRLRQFGMYAARRARSIHSLELAVRVPRSLHLPAMHLVRQAARAAAAAGALRHLVLTANYGFGVAELGPALCSLRTLRLASAEGGLRLGGDLSRWQGLTRLLVEARLPLRFSQGIRLPPRIRELELSCVADELPPELRQLGPSLRRLVVRESQLSEGVHGMEYEALEALTALTSLALERQDGGDVTGWLPPPELSALSALRELSLFGSRCWRWGLVDGYAALALALSQAACLSYLDLGHCMLDEPPTAALAHLPALRVLLLHGNRELLLTPDNTAAWLPRLAVLSLDWSAVAGAHVPAPAQHAPQAGAVLRAGAALRRLAIVGRAQLPAIQAVARVLRFMPHLDAVVVEEEHLAMALHASGQLRAAFRPRAEAWEGVPFVELPPGSGRCGLLRELGLLGDG